MKSSGCFQFIAPNEHDDDIYTIYIYYIYIIISIFYFPCIYYIHDTHTAMNMWQWAEKSKKNKRNDIRRLQFISYMEIFQFIYVSSQLHIQLILFPHLYVMTIFHLFVPIQDWILIQLFMHFVMVRRLLFASRLCFHTLMNISIFLA